MNCPKCGAAPKGAVRAIDTYFDSANGEYLRRCRCAKCMAEFYTIEYVVEPTDNMLAQLAPVQGLHAGLKAGVAEKASRERFDSYRNLQKRVRRERKSHK